MKNLKINLFLTFIAGTVFIIFSCRENLVESDAPIEPIVKIASPFNNWQYNKHERINLHAFLLSGNDTLVYDSIKWNISGYDYTININNFTNYFNVGTYEIVCVMFKDNKTYSSKTEITVNNNVIVDVVLQNDKVTIYNIADNRVYCLAVDNNDNIIVGTAQTGLYIYKNNEWINYDINDGLFENYIQTISVDKNNEIYIGYIEHEGILKITETGLEHIYMDPSLGGDVHTILFDENNILWAATHYGQLCKYENGNWITFPEQRVVDFHHPNKIQFDSKKYLWGASGYASLKYDGQTWDSVFVNGNVVRALSMVIDKNDVVWYGCHNGLYKISETDTVIYNYSNSSLPANSIWSLALDSKNNLWIGTGNGLVKYDGTNWELIDLPIEIKTIFRLAVDSNDKIWFSNSSPQSNSLIFGSYISN